MSNVLHSLLLLRPMWFPILSKYLRTGVRSRVKASMSMIMKSTRKEEKTGSPLWTKTSYPDKFTKFIVESMRNGKGGTYFLIQVLEKGVYDD